MENLTAEQLQRITLVSEPSFYRGFDIKVFKLDELYLWEVIDLIDGHCDYRGEWQGKRSRAFVQARQLIDRQHVVKALYGVVCEWENRGHSVDSDAALESLYRAL